MPPNFSKTLSMCLLQGPVLVTVGTLLCCVALTDASETLFGGPPKSLLEKLANCTVTSLVLFLATLISTQLWGDVVLRHAPFP